MDIYDDDFVGTPVDENFPMNSQRDLQLARFLKPDPEGPVKLLGPTFKPIATLAKLKEHAAACNGVAGLVCFDREKIATIVIWDSEAADSLSRLTNLKLAGGYVVGTITRAPSGEYRVYPDATQSPEQEAICRQFLNLITQEPFELPAFIGQPEKATTILQNYAWVNPGTIVDIADEIIVPSYPENGYAKEVK
jgi:hypothetical protein